MTQKYLKSTWYTTEFNDLISYLSIAINIKDHKLSRWLDAMPAQTASLLWINKEWKKWLNKYMHEEKIY